MAEHLRSCLSLIDKVGRRRPPTPWANTGGHLALEMLPASKSPPCHGWRGGDRLGPSKEPAAAHLKKSPCQLPSHQSRPDLAAPQWGTWSLAPPRRTSLSPRQEEPRCSRRRFVRPRRCSVAQEKRWGLGCFSGPFPGFFPYPFRSDFTPGDGIASRSDDTSARSIFP
jgi:hypothetical protein